jgi:FKBP-type peptidyl-prolyl cis-trans isomerase FklB
MKKIIIATSALIISQIAFSQTKKAVSKPIAKAPVTKKVSAAIVNAADSATYALGVRIAQNLKNQGFDNINQALFMKALNAVLKGDSLLIPETNLDMCIYGYQQVAQSKKAEKSKAVGKTFLDANCKRKNVVTLSSGLQYEILKKSADTTKPSLTDKVKCHYHGTLIDGTIFDSSVDRGEPAVFGVNQVIRGWQEILPLMPVGSKWKIFVPSDMAYGDQQAGPKIAPGSTLIFEIELLGIEK